MQPKLYRTQQPSAPWLVVYSDPTQRDSAGKPKRFRFRFADEKDAVAKHKALLAATHLSGVMGLTFDPRSKAEFTAARQALDAAGHTGISLVEIAHQWMKDHAGPAHLDLPVDGLVAEFVEAKERENMKQRTIDNLENRVNAWIRDGKIARVSDITNERCAALKNRKGVSAQTRKNDMAAASSFLSYLADERKILPTNPLLGVSRPRVDKRTPRTLSPAQALTLLETARRLEGGRLLRYFALCLLAGLRPGEAASTLPESVVIQREGFVRVLQSKRRLHRRSVPLTAAFRAWWKVAPETPAPLFDQKRDRDLFDRIREDAGLIKKGSGLTRKKLVFSLWQDDICRHTWISMRLAETKDEAKVALEAGTSIGMIHDHYLEWLTPKSARDLAALRPTARPSGSAPDPA